MNALKVIIEYENTIEFVEGEDAEKYVKFYEDLCISASNKKQNPYDKPENALNWIKISKDILNEIEIEVKVKQI